MKLKSSDESLAFFSANIILGIQKTTPTSCQENAREKQNLRRLFINAICFNQIN